MHWKLKAMTQNGLSLLPSSASYASYYWIQRHFGRLRRMSPAMKLSAGIETWKRIKKQGYEPKEKVFFETGTGRVPLVPLSYWIMGAKKTISIDLNPYLKNELVKECLLYISENQDQIKKLYGPLLDHERFVKLLNFSRTPNISTTAFLDLCQIHYIAPGDAANTSLAPQSIDFHTSYNVLEHIPEEVLKTIFIEGLRIISGDGLFIHRIDYSDHFSGADKNISAINFLQYSDIEWERYAGNRYMYMNRLRHDDFIHLFQSAGHQIMETEATIDTRSRGQLSNKTLKVNERFSAKSDEILSTTGAWIVTKRKSIEQTPQSKNNS